MSKPVTSRDARRARRLLNAAEAQEPRCRLPVLRRAPEHARPGPPLLTGAAAVALGRAVAPGRSAQSAPWTRPCCRSARWALVRQGQQQPAGHVPAAESPRSDQAWDSFANPTDQSSSSFIVHAAAALDEEEGSRLAVPFPCSRSAPAAVETGGRRGWAARDARNSSLREAPGPVDSGAIGMYGSHTSGSSTLAAAGLSSGSSANVTTRSSPTRGCSSRARPEHQGLA
jgi:hypothetical protein